MLDRYSGKVIHIDFGDCFEVAIQREQFAEKVPFRLTRMLVNAMGVSGVEGVFRSTCESVMRVLRDNKDSLLALLDSFVHDPLINWRLAALQEKKEKTDSYNIKQQTSSFDRDLYQMSIQSPRHKYESPESQYRIANSVINRIECKLTGKDFPGETLDVQQQVDRLIEQATSVQNLCQMYLGKKISLELILERVVCVLVDYCEI